MSFSTQLRAFFVRKQSANCRTSFAPSRRLRLENLEERNLLSATTLGLHVPPIKLQDLIEATDRESLPPSDSVLFDQPSIHDAGDFYWHFDERIPLLRRNNEIVVKLLPEANRDSVLDALTLQTGLGLRSITNGSLDSRTLLLSGDMGETDVFSSTKEHTLSIPGVAWIAPVLIGAESNAIVYLKDEIGVALNPGVDPKEFFATGFSEWRRFFDNQYIATLKTGGGLGALETANALSIDPRVEWATPNFDTDFRVAAIPNDTFYDLQWNLDNTGQTDALIGADSKLEAAWDITSGGFTPAGSATSRIVVAVLDNGVQLAHPDLEMFINQDEIPPAIKAQLTDVDEDGIITFVDMNDAANAAFVFDHNANGRIDTDDLLLPIDTNDWQDGGWEDGVDGDQNEEVTQNGFVDDLFGWDFAGAFGVNVPDNDPNPTTQHDNHGTAVAGVAGALGDSNAGIAGAAWNVQVLPIKIARDDNGLGGGFVSFSTIAQAVYYAAGIVIEDGEPTGETWRAADILVNSWGGGGPNAMLSNAFNYIQSNGRNGLGVASFNASANAAAGTTQHLNYETVGFNVPAGNWAFEWRYTKNATDPGNPLLVGDDRAWLANVRLPNGTTQRFDAPGIPVNWTTTSTTGGANTLWTVVDDPEHAYGTGRYVVQAGAITHNQETRLRSPTVTVPGGNGVLSYSVWNSSQFGADGLRLFASQNGGAFFEVDQFQDPDDPYPFTFFSGVPAVTSLVSYPANLSSTIAVGASTDWDYRAAYSQYGSSLDFVAPSGGGYAGVPSTDRTGADGYDDTGDYVFGLSGTSFSTPLAAGVAALMLSKNPSLTASQIRTIMRSTTDKVGGDNGATEYIDDAFNLYYGYGRVNAAEALAATHWPGDYNDNGTVDLADYSVWRTNLGHEVTLPNDITPGFVDVSDYSVWKTNFGATATTPPTANFLPGDYNDDGIVDAADYTPWRTNLHQSVTLPNDVTPGFVDVDDFFVWRLHFGETLGSSQGTGSAAVPGDYNLDGVVDDLDYDVWQFLNGSTTNLAADGNFDGVVNVADYLVWREMRGVTTMETIPGDFNGDGIVNWSDFELWEDGDPLADANEDEVVDEADFAIWEAHYGLTDAGVYPFTLIGNGGPPLRVAGEAPRVTNVTLGHTLGNHPDYSFESVVGSGEQLRTVPIGGLDVVSISFSEEVLVTQGALALTGMQSQSIPGVSDFTYDLETQTATWQFSSALPKGQYLIQLSDSIFDLDHDALDGEFDNPWALADASGTSSTFPSGDGEAGGEFRFRFTNLAGDFNSDNIVDIADYTVWANNQWRDSGALQTQGDADGNGDVNTADNTIRIQQFGTNYVNWPFYEPGMILVTTLVDENGTNPAAMSLREALALATTQAGHDTIVFAPSLFSSGPGTITIAEQLTIDSNVSIVGPGADLLSISGDEVTRVVLVQSGKTVEISGVSIVDGNVVGGRGGGIYNFGDLTLDSVVISNNVATDLGGGIYNGNGTIRILNSTISENTTSNNGGGLASNANGALSIVVENSAIINNEANNGGGFYLHVYTAGISGASGQFTNSTISGNSAFGHGGGVEVVGGFNVLVVQSTITNNHANTGALGGKGGGFYLVNSMATLHNSIVADNTAESAYAEDIWSNWGLNSASSYNFIGSNGNSGLSSGTANNNIVGLYTLPISPGLTALGNYGGLTKTHALLSTSLAIDKGSNARSLDELGVPLLRDQRGSDRFVDWDEDQDERVDIGAFELALEEMY